MEKVSKIYKIAEEFKPETLDALRREMRAFYPDECHGICKSPEIVQNYENILHEMNEFYERDPDMSVFAAKKKYYQTMGEKFKPVIFRNSPFYFEGGINGGWIYEHVGKIFFLKNFQDRFNNSIPVDRMNRENQRNMERFTLCCGNFIDDIHHISPITSVFEQGFKGIYEKAAAEMEKCTDRIEKQWFEAMLSGLDAVRSIQLKFAMEAERIIAQEVLTPEQKTNMERIAESAKHVPWEPPRTFYEALNIAWFLREILSAVDGLSIFSLGRPDYTFRELYEKDLAAGRLTEADAFNLVAQWLLISECHHDPFGEIKGYSEHEAEMPVTVGGCGRDGKEVFNDITIMVILAHRKLNLAFPKMHCRCSAKSSEEYIRLLAEDVFMERAVHTIFNDDITIETLCRSGKTLEDAREYLCSGCWDAGCDSRENVYDANYFSLARVLEAMIYPSEELNEKVDFKFTELDNMQSYEEVCSAVIDNISGFARQWLEDRTASECGAVLYLPHPLYSACLDGCIEKHRDETSGGAKYNTTIITLGFLPNVVDSLLVIRKLCFEDRICTLHELLQCVRSNWTLRPELRREALKAPHWGDDTPASTELANRIQSAVYRVCQSLQTGRGGRYDLSGWIYREYRFWGEKMRALPDGRYHGDYLAQALNPSTFRNDKDLTTVLNAISRLDHRKFSSSNVNMTLEKSNASVEVLSALFRTFCALKIHMLQPNCQSRETLLDARKHPEKYPNLIIKICGFSARFVALSPEWQNAILDRYFY